MADVIAIQQIRQAVLPQAKAAGAKHGLKHFWSGKLMAPSTRAMGCNVRDSMKLNSQKQK